MPPNAVVIVADAHFDGSRPGAERAFTDFLAWLPDQANHLVINGDLFDFWFEYRRVIRRDAFSVLSGLDRARAAGVRLSVIGGNHDRWGGRFWKEQMGADFYRESAELMLLGKKSFVAHGDGLSETRFENRIMHTITRHRLTEAAFRLVHPDIGYWIAEHWPGLLGERARRPEVIDKAAAAQEAYAQEFMGQRQELELVVLAHTHRGVVKEIVAGRWYVNPGAWMLGYSYALLTAEGPVLRSFEGSR